MKEKLKNNKGITLVALVITIIILLILAMVSISLVMNTRIINHANNAVTSYKEAEENEQKQLNAIADEIGKYTEKTDTEWWNPTEKELSDMKNDGENRYYVAYNGIYGSWDNGLQILYEVDEIRVLINKSAYIFYISEELVNEEFEYWGMKIEKFKWYKVEIEDQKEILIEYKGSFPINESDLIAGEIYSTTYLQKIINSFGK